jgi:hypothetical protein
MKTLQSGTVSCRISSSTNPETLEHRAFAAVARKRWSLPASRERRSPECSAKRALMAFEMKAPGFLMSGLSLDRSNLQYVEWE